MNQPPLHIVAVMGLVRDGDRVLMIDSPRRGWECPGGQVEIGEDPIVALKREVEEETGCRCSARRLAAINANVGKRPNSLISMDFVCDYESGEPRTSRESRDVRWMTPQEALAAVGQPAMMERVRHLLAFDGGHRLFTYRLDPYVIESTQAL
ncbi:MAG: NUDIX domain-containing protein [Planctomycetota bacterium]